MDRQPATSLNIWPPLRGEPEPVTSFSTQCLPPTLTATDSAFFPMNHHDLEHFISFLCKCPKCGVIHDRDSTSFPEWDYIVSYTRMYKTSAGCLRSICLVHPGVRDKRWVSEIDLSQPRHETAFWWRHNGPVTSQLTDPIKWPNYPLELIGIYVHINTHNKESLTQRCRRSTNVQLCLISLYIYLILWISIWFES